MGARGEVIAHCADESFEEVHYRVQVQHFLILLLQEGAGEIWGGVCSGRGGGKSTIIATKSNFSRKRGLFQSAGRDFKTSKKQFISGIPRELLTDINGHQGGSDLPEGIFL